MKTVTALHAQPESALRQVRALGMTVGSSAIVAIVTGANMTLPVQALRPEVPDFARASLMLPKLHFCSATFVEARRIRRGRGPFPTNPEFRFKAELPQLPNGCFVRFLAEVSVTEEGVLVTNPHRMRAVSLSREFCADSPWTNFAGRLDFHRFYGGGTREVFQKHGELILN